MSGLICIAEVSMIKQEMLNNIEIAKKYLAKYHLLVPENEIFLECLFLPPFRWSTYFIQVLMKQSSYYAHCTYTYYADYFGNASHSQSFTTVERADKQSAKRGDVICKCIKMDTQIIEEIIRIVKEDIVIKTQKITTIDGISANIRLYDKGTIVDDFCLNTPEIPPELLNVFIAVSEIITNG